MATYVILATLTDKGRQDIAGIAQRRQKNIQELQKHDIRIVTDYALMGAYDFLYVVEAPDNETIMRQVIQEAGNGTLAFQTMPAIPMDQFESVAVNVKQHEG